jgi:capsular exopolysaccharide synthesis family protein
MLLKGKGEIADAIRPLIEEPNPGTGELVRRADAPSAPEQAVVATAPLESVRSMQLRLTAPSPLLPFERGQRWPSEQYRILRTKISHHPKQPHLIVVSSPAPGDGKSVSAINTAGALSLKSEGQVLLIDADLRRSAIHSQLGLPESPGLTDVLRGACKLEAALIHVQEFPNLFVLPAGPPVDNPAELLDSSVWQSLAARIRSLFRYAVLDSPPVTAVADYELIQAVSDGVILVVRPDHTNRLLCQKALETVPKAKLLGVLMNCVPDWAPAKRAVSGADYYYYSGEREYRGRSGKGQG